MFSDFNLFSDVVNKAKDGLEHSEEEQAANILTFINVVKKIIRFIDRKILISCRFHSEEDDIVPMLEYYPEKGIRVYLHDADHFEPLIQTVEINKVFPHQQKVVSSSVHRVRGGEELYLTRDGKLILFTRSGNADDFMTSETETNLFALINPREVQPVDMIRRYGDFSQEFLFNFKRAMVDAIKQNANKQPILAKVIDYINAMNKNMDDEIETRSILEKEPDNIEMLVKYAKILQRMNRNKDELEKARECFKKALDLDPSRLDTYFDYADFSCFIKDFKMARELLQKAIELYPDSSRAHEEYASLWMSENMAEPRDQYLARLRLDSDAVQGFEVHYLKAIELDPSNITAIDRYGLFLHWVKHDDEAALAQHKRAIEMDPPFDGSFQYYIARSRGMQRDVADTEAAFRKALELWPKNIDFRLYYINFLQVDKHDLEGADREFSILLDQLPPGSMTDATGPGAEHIFWQHGVFLQFAKHDLDGAEARYKQAYEMITDSDTRAPDILANIGSVQFLKNDAETARKTIDRALFITAHENLIPITNFGSLGPNSREELRKHMLDAVRLGCLFLLYSHEPDPDDPNHYLKQIKTLVDAGIQLYGWDVTLDLHVRKAVEENHPELVLLRALSRVITGARKPKSLNKFIKWRES